MAYEVCIKIRFSEPCLGNERAPDPEPNRMRRNTEGEVVFAVVWWRSMVVRAAEIYSKHQKRVNGILWTPEVDGTVKLYKRYYYMTEGTHRVKRFKQHEAFLDGDVIGVKALLPSGLPIGDFQEILTLAGSYLGISPYGWRRGFGKFKVESVERVYPQRRKNEDSDTDSKGKPAECATNDIGTDDSGKWRSDVQLQVSGGAAGDVREAMPCGDEQGDAADRDTGGSPGEVGSDSAEVRIQDRDEVRGAEEVDERPDEAKS